MKCNENQDNMAHRSQAGEFKRKELQWSATKNVVRALEVGGVTYEIAHS
jgi:hypothetical protein